jgi:hypothetical protein
MTGFSSGRIKTKRAVRRNLPAAFICRQAAKTRQGWQKNADDLF